MKEYGIDMSLPFITQCCVCRRYKMGKNWTNDVYFFPEAVNVSHGYCPECQAKVKEDIRV